MSQYAVEPSASARVEESFEAPAQRPASPEIAESPTVTTVGVPTPGPSAAAAGATTPSTTMAATTALNPARISYDLPRSDSRQAGDPLRSRAPPVNPAGAKAHGSATPAGNPVLTVAILPRAVVAQAPEAHAAAAA